MKKNILSVLAICAALFGCQKNEISETLSSGDDLHATIEDVSSTKTYMDADNNIRWSENDQIVAFMKTSLGLKYQVAEESVGKTSARFVKKTNGGSDDLYGGTDWDHNVVYYPYSETVEAAKSGSGYALDVILPSEQAYAPESFANGAMAMVALSEDNNITFKNVLGGMKIQLKGTQTVKSINLQGKNNEKLSGAAVVTAYTDETKPAITMSQTASTSVTLNCGSGVQLSESTATEFIITLPPVLFSKGFTVTVTDSDSKTYTVETDKANTVLRSSILVMPAFKLGDTPDQGGNDDNLIKTVYIDKTSMTLVPGTSYTFETDVDPFDASNTTLSWSSSASSVVSVDQNGKITSLSEGTAIISAVAVGGATASCTIIVISCAVPSVDYVDEYGVNHGKGIAIGATVWAPVNCGYKAETSDSKGFPYGKLYQWGRKYGQGYSTSYDESSPELVSGPVMLSVGQAESNTDKFYYNSESPNDWSKIQTDDIWNSGTESSPVKTKYDPCPEGWRVPTYSELRKLCNNYSLFGAGQLNQKGRYFSGDYTYLDGCPEVFFPAAGHRHYEVGRAYSRGNDGYYWSSRPSDYDVYGLLFDSSSSHMYNYANRAGGYSVRCVQE